MSKERECKQLLRQLTGEKKYDTFVAKVSSVDGATCTVRRVIDGKELQDVRLNVNAAAGGTVITRKLESAVLVTTIDGYAWFVCLYSEIESISLNVSDRVDLNADGSISLNVSDTIEINAGGENLRQILSDIIDEVSKIVVVQGTGPNVPALNMIKQRLGKLLK